MKLFTTKDFRIFDIPGFHDRMAAIASGIRPKLTEIGQTLAPEMTDLVDNPLFVHVAKHARRTVNPPDDTWAALGSGKRGYKKDVHFKVAISRNCIRLLFEVGPEYYDKREWLLKWKRSIKQINESLGASEQLSWFKDEHDEDPARSLAEFSQEEVKTLCQVLTERADGQLVIGRRIDQVDVTAMKPNDFKVVALETFESMAMLFSLHPPRVIT